MSLTVSFSFDTMAEKEMFEQYARSKGMKLSALAKMATYQYRAKYPHRNEKMREVTGCCGDDTKAPETVQPHGLEDSGDGDSD